MLLGALGTIAAANFEPSWPHIAYLDFKHGHSLGGINIVPDTEIVSVLSDNNIAVGNPLNVATVVQNGRLGRVLNVIKMQL